VYDDDEVEESNTAASAAGGGSDSSAVEAPPEDPMVLLRAAFAAGQDAFKLYHDLASPAVASSSSGSGGGGLGGDGKGAYDTAAFFDDIYNSRPLPFVVGTQVRLTPNTFVQPHRHPHATNALRTYYGPARRFTRASTRGWVRTSSSRGKRSLLPRLRGEEGSERPPRPWGTTSTTTTGCSRCRPPHRPAATRWLSTASRQSWGAAGTTFSRRYA